MDNTPSSNGSRPSGIPRLSRLPVPRAAVRPSASRENLQQSQISGIANTRLRSTPSRDQLFLSSTKRNPSTAVRSRDSSSQLRNVPNGDIHNNVPIDRKLQPGGENGMVRKPSQVLPSGVALVMEDGYDISNTNAAETVDDNLSTSKSISLKPSLSERAVETLQNIPSTPAVRKRTSSFFNPESPMRPMSSSTHSSRPSSSDTSMMPPARSFSSRPPSSQSNTNPIDFRASTDVFKAPKSAGLAQTPMKRPSVSNLRTPSGSRQPIVPGSADTSKLTSRNLLSSKGEGSPSPFKTVPKTRTTEPSGKSLLSRPLKPRASMNGLFQKTLKPTQNQAGEIDRIGFVPKKKPTSFSNTSSEATSTVSKITTATSISNEEQEAAPRKASLALRDQIAKAKAAKRAAAKQSPCISSDHGDDSPVIPTGSFDFGLAEDPFNQQSHQSGGKALLRKRIQSARNDGRLNISAMGFKDIPAEVLNMYNFESIGNDGGSWAEAVDLTRFVAAGNELELLQDEVFPDVDAREIMDDEDAKGNQFGGLETLDLHGNVLIAIPPGLRRLELLTTLNISNNKLNNECLETISQISSLRDLKIGGNSLVGALDVSVAKLHNLESLDIQRNALTSLPNRLADLIRLRVLNITDNRIQSLPFESLQQIPLAEILAAKNNLTGDLFPANVNKLSGLQILDVSNNSLSRISASINFNLPSLHQLNCSSNRLTDLPEMTSWPALRNLTAEDNNITTIPEGFVSLSELRTVDLSGNNIKVLDDRIGCMSSLDIFRISGNPLREKKFSGMSTEDLKRALKARLVPEDVEAKKNQDGDVAFPSPPVSPFSPNRPNASDWLVKSGGILDRSNTKSFSFNPVVAAEVAANHTIKVLHLHHNLFTEIPNSIAFFAATLNSLVLSHNELNSDTFIKDELELPALKELNLSSNTFNSLQPLIQKLYAPRLERLDISFNRLVSLPPLKSHFPSLITLMASNNTIKELFPDSIKGLRTVDCSSNDISSLNARIGLLGGPGGLERLDVSGNRFRVPKHTILEKGTEATLAWLRDRIPAGESGSPTETC